MPPRRIQLNLLRDSSQIMYLRASRIVDRTLDGTHVTRFNVIIRLSLRPLITMAHCTGISESYGFLLNQDDHWIAYIKNEE